MLADSGAHEAEGDAGLNGCEAADGGALTPHIDPATPEHPPVSPTTQLRSMADTGYTDTVLLLPVSDDIQFSVTHARPVREGALQHWVYGVKMTTTLGQWFVPEGSGPVRGLVEDGEKVTLSREVRYSRWDWLRQALADRVPGCILPPIPEKEATSAADKIVAMFSSDQDEASAPPVVHFRKRALEYFLTYLAGHTALRQLPLLNEWFVACDDDEEFRSLRRRWDGGSVCQLPTESPLSRSLRSFRSWRRPTPSEASSDLEASFASQATCETGCTDAHDDDIELAELTHRATRRTAAAKELLKQAEGLYLESLRRVSLRFGRWADGSEPQRLAPAELRVGKAVWREEQGRGIVRWVGRLKGRDPKHLWLGVEWSEPSVGACDGEFEGTRYFQTAPAGANFCSPESLLSVPIFDDVTAALEGVSRGIGTSLSYLQHYQERRLFHVVSDLRLVIGWHSSVLNCTKYFSDTSRRLAEADRHLARMRQTKKESVEAELRLEESIQKLRRTRDNQRVTFTTEVERLEGITAGLWRGLLHNFGRYTGNLESHGRVYQDILGAACRIESEWDSGDAR
eukprot:TRINITY_DN32591_c0_g1_i1.p1 TRINITY_DN32591_c0_g1~~TRINITY_DN32591_c0_g1_i1.p1  ORF type:complete len:570 (+),score=124.82 TRINITY_DN32591_c0_g1_i1:51-1760(+)